MTMLLLSAYASCIAQNVADCETDLQAVAARRAHFLDRYINGHDTTDMDSIVVYNEKLQTRLLECTQTQESLDKPFKSLEEYNVGLTRSPDGLLSIYSWDDETGGTMRYAISVFQFSDGHRVFSQKPIWLETEDPDESVSFFYDVLDEVVSGGKKYYVVKGVAVGSSAVSVHTVKIFSVEDGVLNSDARLIKTQTGIRNELSYEIDFSASPNRDNPINREEAWLQYDAKSHTICIPLIQENGRLTRKKIRYRFTGTYFEKI
ncbi:hypothetical protein FLLO111716_05835 [Flavobacterium longum]